MDSGVVFRGPDSRRMFPETPDIWTRRLRIFYVKHDPASFVRDAQINLK